MDIQNGIDAFTNPTKYLPLPKHGFLIYSKEKELTEAEIQAGKKLKGDFVYIVRRGSSWKGIRDSRRQLAGNIDWVGLQQSDKDYPVVTVNGPPSRYWNFNNEWSYSNDNADEIYHNGLCIGAAPKACFGACFIDVPKTKTVEGQTVNYTERQILAFCAGEETVIAYVQPYQYGFTRAQVTEYKSVMKSGGNGTYRNSENVVVETVGWGEVGSGRFAGSVHNTPWFFASDGLSARAMKCVDHTFNTGNNADQATEKVMVVIKAFTVVDNGTVRVTFQDATYTGQGFTFMEEVTQKFETVAGQTADANYYGYATSPLHSFRWKQVDIVMKFCGTMEVAIDYDFLNKKWIKAIYRQQTWRQYVQNLVRADYGDPPGATWAFADDSGEAQNGSWHHRVTFLPADDPSVFEELRMNQPDGSRWVGVGTSYSGLYVGDETIKGHVWGTTFSDLWSGVQTNQGVDVPQWFRNHYELGGQNRAGGIVAGRDDPIEQPPGYLYFIESYCSYLHYLDIRHKTICGRTTLHEWEDGKQRRIHSEWMIQNKDGSHRHPYIENEEGMRTMGEYSDPDTQDPGVYPYWQTEFGVHQVYAFDELPNFVRSPPETTITRYCHNGELNTQNEDNSIQKWSWAHVTTMQYADLFPDWRCKGWYEMISNATLNPQQSGFASTIYGDYIAYYKYSLGGPTAPQVADVIGPEDSNPTYIVTTEYTEINPDIGPYPVGVI